MVRSLVYVFMLFFAVTFCVATEEIAINFSDSMFAQLDGEEKNSCPSMQLPIRKSRISMKI